MSATEWLCIILIIVLEIIGIVWMIKADEPTSYRVPLVFLQTIVSVAIIGSILCANGIIVL